MNKKNLGFGLMRLQMAGEAVDIAACCEMTDRFMAAGGTYFDIFCHPLLFLFLSLSNFRFSHSHGNECGFNSACT